MNSTKSGKVQLKVTHFSATTLFSWSHDKVEYSDVTLASSDGVLHRAHRIVLAANSGFFSGVLPNLNHAQPLIYMHGVTSDDLAILLDLIYHGKAIISVDRLLEINSLFTELRLRDLVVEHQKGGEENKKGEETVSDMRKVTEEPTMRNSPFSTVASDEATELTTVNKTKRSRNNRSTKTSKKESDQDTFVTSNYMRWIESTNNEKNKGYIKQKNCNEESTNKRRKYLLGVASLPDQTSIKSGQTGKKTSCLKEKDPSYYQGTASFAITKNIEAHVEISNNSANMEDINPFSIEDSSLLHSATFSLNPSDLTELKQLWLSHLTLKENGNVRSWNCRCGKEFGSNARWNAFRHVDSYHLPNVQHQCPVCSLTFDLHSNLKQHYKIAHTSRTTLKDIPTTAEEKLNSGDTVEMEGHGEIRGGSFRTFLTNKLGDCKKKSKEESCSWGTKRKVLCRTNISVIPSKEVDVESTEGESFESTKKLLCSPLENRKSDLTAGNIEFSENEIAVEISSDED